MRSCVGTIRPSPALVKFRVEAESAVLVARAAERDSRAHVVFQLDGRVLRLCDVRRECDEEIAGYTLLNRDTSSGVLLIASQFGIDRQLRNAGDFFQAARNLAGD